jgi:site-specific recombinase XerD
MKNNQGYLLNQDYLLKLERELKYRNYSVKTIKAYSTCIRLFLNKVNKNPEIITRNEIIDFLLFLQTKKKSPKTINLYKESIKFFYKEILKQKQELDIKFSREAKKLPVILTKNEIIKIIENTKNNKYKFIISLSYSA